MKYYATKFANTTHSPLPQFVTHGNAIYAHPANKTVGTHVTPWFERRGNKIYATPSNPAGGHSALPWFTRRCITLPGIRTCPCTKFANSMAKDKYSAVWVSHSSMGDFLRCPRAYYLHNVYKDPKTGKKISIVNGALSLGIAVHETLEALKEIPLEERKKRDLLSDFETQWAKVTGKQGGFKNEEEEKAAKERGKAMIERVIANPGPIERKTVRLKSGKNDMIPNFYLSEKDNIILCGMIDWLEYIPENDSIVVIDFKTGKNDENEDSLQLPIYLLLLNELQKRKVTGAAYWYLDREDGYVEKKLPSVEEAREKVLVVAKQVKEAREKKEFLCPRGEQGCFNCKPFEAILKGEAEYVGLSSFGNDSYFLP